MEWKEELEKLGTKIYQGELRHAIHGVLHDSKKLEAFIQSILDEEYIRGYNQCMEDWKNINNVCKAGKTLK